MIAALLLAAAAPHSVQHRPHEDSISVEQQVKVYELARQVCPKQETYEAAKKRLRMADQLLLSSMCQMYLRGALDTINMLEAAK